MANPLQQNPLAEACGLENIRDRFKALAKYGVPKNAITIVLAAGMNFEEWGGTPLRDYWKSEAFAMRDEYFLVANTLFSLRELIPKIEPSSEWRLSFDVAFLFQLKSTAHSVLSIDLMTKSNCYSDALTVVRAMHSRLNLLILCSLSPPLFDNWLKNPKGEKFLDGHIRRELEGNKIDTMEHMYQLSSEIIHGQFLGLANVGYLKAGVFPEIPPIENQIYVAAKYIMAMSYYSMLSMVIIDLGPESYPELLQNHEELFDFLDSKTLAPFRFDHLYTMVGEERHWKKIGKDKFKIGSAFNFKGYRKQLLKFHRDKGQRKKLSKKYLIK